MSNIFDVQVEVKAIRMAEKADAYARLIRDRNQRPVISNTDAQIESLADLVSELAAVVKALAEAER